MFREVQAIQGQLSRVSLPMIDVPDGGRGWWKELVECRPGSGTHNRDNSYKDVQAPSVVPHEVLCFHNPKDLTHYTMDSMTSCNNRMQYAPNFPNFPFSLALF